MGLSGVSMSQWAADILAGLGAPRTQNNINNLAAWAACETSSAANNPFNTTLGESGATNYNSVGVKNYASYSQGLNATVSTIKQQNMSAILAALKADAARPQFGSAVGGSPWGTSGSCIGGSTARAGNVAPSKSAQQATATLTSAQQASCAIGFNGTIPVIPGVFSQTVSACLLSKSQARAVLGILSLATGAAIMGAGFGFVAAFSKPGKMVLNFVASTGIGGQALGAGVQGAREAGASQPGQRLTEGEVKQARSNRRKLDTMRKEDEKAAAQESAA